MPHDRERPEGNDRVIAKEPCPDCGSKDNLVRYADGHAWCFSPGCGRFEPGEGEGGQRTMEATVVPAQLLKPDERPDAWDPISGRKIEGRTMRRYGYFRGLFKPQGHVAPTPCHVAPYYDQDDRLVVQKLRLPEKEFVALKAPGAPPLNECRLFGHHVYGDRFDRRVIVTEGELDALSVAQVIDFKAAVVSVNTGTGGAAKCLQANYLWLDRFGEIVLWFDDDEPGRIAVDECARLFPVGKVRVAKAPGFKDASAALQANKPGDIEAAIYMAVAWEPQGIVSARGVLDRVDFDAPPPPRYPLPWPKLSEVLYGGLATEDVVFILSGSGKGKSTFLFEVLSHLEEGGLTVGGLFFEDTLEDVVHGLLTVRASARLRLDPSLATAADKQRMWAEIATNNRLYLFDGESARWGLDSLLTYIRFLAKACGCDFVVIDPLSFLIAQSDIQDERKAIDNVVAELAVLGKQLGIGIIVTHHLTRPQGEAGHEEGADIFLKQARGAHGIGMFSTLALGLRWHPDLGATSVKCLKSRKQGELSGTTLGWLQYQPETGRVVEIPPPPPPSGGFNKSDSGPPPEPQEY